MRILWRSLFICLFCWWQQNILIRYLAIWIDFVYFAMYDYLKSNRNLLNYGTTVNPLSWPASTYDHRPSQTISEWKSRRRRRMRARIWKKEKAYPLSLWITFRWEFPYTIISRGFARPWRTFDCFVKCLRSKWNWQLVIELARQAGVNNLNGLLIVVLS